jgi:MSHA biogenesis protein MshO
MPAQRPDRQRQTGFTLIEAIMVIVITGILVGIVAVFITQPVQGYADSVKRAELTDAADVYLRRIMRDVRRAVPNSLRFTTGTCPAPNAGLICNFIEFIWTSNGGRYRDASDGSTNGNILDFTASVLNPACNSQLCFDVLGIMPSNPAIAAGDYIVVNNQVPGQVPGDAYNFNKDANSGNGGCRVGGCNVAKVSVTPSTNLVTLYNNPFQQGSPNYSFQVVPGNVMAVTYTCPITSRGNLTRYWNYGFNTIQSTTPGGTTALLATNVTCKDVTYLSALLSISLTLTDPTSGESVTLFQQIHPDI